MRSWLGDLKIINLVMLF